ncbi:DAK2 domain-containing protein [Candidatus Phytoplasma australasiaticum]|uniref:DAK2 domain-containing protein n=1 Tax=Candidatus Phytoplasma australasiaticum TaxID=2754999 RepID=UPI00271227E1|nr:DAK2 domain-containing protein [Candidatus Phytoplasma australasiaticum]MDO8060385.1 DAK2 domain-containing protein [Candidatus Phytoplasma australasiaticum]
MPISEQTIDGLLFKEMVINGTINLKKNCQKINNLNVFPVPDGDTGTNMYMTMAEGIRHIYYLNENSITEVSRVLANALIMSSKGNSGVILSQFFSGLSNKLIQLKKSFVNIEEFIQSLISGYQQAYDSIFSPVEGTILTVLRDSLEAINDQKFFNNIEELLKQIIKYAKKSLEKTPELLPILKESNVVDSGAAGLIYFFEGMLLCCQGSKLSLKEFDKDFLLSKEILEDFDHYKATEISDISSSKIPYCYCTEFVVQLYQSNELSLSKLRKQFIKFGNSLIVILNEKLLKIHIHTNKPGLVLTNLLKYGFLIKSKIDNIKEQNKIFLQEQNFSYDNSILKKNYVLIATTPNATINEIFRKDFKVDYLIIIEQREIIWDFFWTNFNKILNKLEISDVILFPNNPEILANSDLIKNFNNFNISIMNTSNIAQGYNALVAFDETLSYSENISHMNDNIKNNLVGKILFNPNVNLLENFSSDFEAFLDSTFFKKNNNLEILIIELLQKMITKTTQLITIFYDQQLEKHDSLIGLEKFLFNNYNDLEINKIKNNDNMHYYLILVEN